MKKFFTATLIAFLVTFVGYKVVSTYNEKIVVESNKELSSKKDEKELLSTKVSRKNDQVYTTFDPEKIKKDENSIKKYLENELSFSSVNDLKVKASKNEERFESTESFNFFFPTKSDDLEKALASRSEIEKGIKIKVNNIDQNVLSVTSGSYNYLSIVNLKVNDREIKMLLKYSVDPDEDISNINYNII